MSLLQQYIDEQKLYQTEGRRGVVNLCRIARALGYKDPMYFGQLEHNATIGDLICFLEDNPGAITAIIEWIDKVQCWDDELESQVELDDEENDDEE